MATVIPPARPDKRSFLAALAQRNEASVAELATLQQSGARSPEAVLSLLRSFPSIAAAGLLDAPRLSNAAMRENSESLQAYLAQSEDVIKEAGIPPANQLGAAHPVGAAWEIDEHVPSVAATTSLDELLERAHAEIGAIDTRVCTPWPVRDQAFRGTCVAFAVTALREALLCESESPRPDLSEQFLYWAIKNCIGDHWPNQDGTLIEFAVSALAQYGVCLESDCTYNANFVIGDPGQNAPPNSPSSKAISNALAMAHASATYNVVSTTTGSAASIRTALQRGRPVAISVPVFSDPLLGAGMHNWNTRSAVLYGDILNPPPTSIASGGHAVCITGFRPDPDEPNGGYFILRNSWGTTWGQLLPAIGYHAPEVGYGQISATYIERFLWEWCQL